MKFLVLSDLHANWWALQSVLKDAENQYDQVLCCGDIVGYNPRPTEVLHWARQNCYRATVDHIVTQLNVPLLTALHLQRTQRAPVVANLPASKR